MTDPTPSETPSEARSQATNRRSWRSMVLGYVGKGALVFGIVGTALWLATKGVAGVAWSDVTGVLESVDSTHLFGLAVVWLLGLLVYSMVLSAAMPGLGLRRSLLMNLGGSAVSNAIPMGGAFGTALNWRMASGWGYSNGAFVAYCVLTNILDVLSKLVLPLIAVGALVMVSAHVGTLGWVLAASGAGGLLLAALIIVLLSRTAAYTPKARWAQQILSQLQGSWGRVRQLFHDAWLRMLSASVGYVITQLALFDMSLHAVGLHPTIPVVLMAFAIERCATIIPITPGGAGPAELGAIAWLVAAGLDPAAVVAGVLLFRVFLVIMEIPVGGGLLVGWACWRRLFGSERAGAAA